MITTSGSDSCSVATSEVAAQLPVMLDTKGRVRTSKEQRQVILAEFERSGESMPGFAQRIGVKYSTFAGWVARYRRAQRPARKSPLRLIEAVLPASASGLSVHLPGGARLEISQASQVPLVVALVHALEKPC